MKKPKKKRHYGVQCSGCQEKLFSLHVHDFHHCKCKGTFIDGGYDYLRYGWDKVDRPKEIYRLVPRQTVEAALRRSNERWPY